MRTGRGYAVAAAPATMVTLRAGSTPGPCRPGLPIVAVRSTVTMYRRDTSTARREDARRARLRHPRPPAGVPDARLRAAQAARHQARRVPGRNQLRLALPDAAAPAGRGLDHRVGGG